MRTLDSLPDEVFKTLLSADVIDEERTLDRSSMAASLDGAFPALPEIVTNDAERGWAHLKLGETLGAGGMAEVFAGDQVGLGRIVAVKVPHSRGAAYRALIREGQIMGGLEHPNIVPVHSLGAEPDGRPILVMKKISGEVWLDRLRREAAASRILTPDGLQAHLQILIQVCNALSFAHDQGVVHRDLKPSNVMIGAYGEVYVLDWGIALNLNGPLDDSGVRVVGTLSYMAPEMLLGTESDITVQTDVYQLGAILHRLLTGHARHRGKQTATLVQSISDCAPFDYDETVPGELAALCNRAMSRDPAQRPADAAAFREALSAYLSHRSSLALSGAAEEVLRRFEIVSRLGSPAEEGGDTLRYRLLGEARFGFQQALGAWPENEDARQGLQRAVSRLIVWELEHGAVEPARRLLLDLPAPDLALEEAVAAAEARAAERRARLAELERRERELDPNAANRWKMVLALVVGVVSGLGPVTEGILVERGLIPERSAAILLWPTLSVGLIGVVILLLRGQLVVNTFNKRLIGVVTVVLAGFWFNRLRALLAGSDLLDVVAGEPLIFAVGLGVASRVHERRLARLVPILLATSLVASADLQRAGLWVGMGNFLALSSIALMWKRAGEAEGGGSPG